MWALATIAGTKPEPGLIVDGRLYSLAAVAQAAGKTLPLSLIHI